LSDPLSEMIRRVLREAPFAMRQLAGDAGLSYDVLRSWRSGRRRPSRASATRLAAGLEARGQRLLLLSQELRSALEEEGGETGGPERATAMPIARPPESRAEERAARPQREEPLSNPPQREWRHGGGRSTEHPRRVDESGYAGGFRPT
jgi:transcriptional regulator with XRE-family HTH domain